MKVSVNWLKQFTDIELSIDELLARIGSQLGAIEEVIDIGARYKGVVVARVVSCEKHPNADKLSLCMIDDGGAVGSVERNESGHVQVVCGAPNVREGMLVAWLPPGSTVPSSYDKEPFVLEARELRGKVSNGMLASASELAISDDHSGIVEIDIESQPGQSFAEVYELNDFVIDIENKMFTHRPDCFGVLGVAREVAGIQNIQFKSPDWYLQALDRIKPGSTQLPLEVRNDIPELVPRYMAIAMADVEVKPSPLIIQTYLSRVGLRPVNNIVDVTNYIMMITGQPLHAFDYDKIKEQDDGADKATIVVRHPEEGETIALLNGKTIAPRQEAIMIASVSKLIGVGGVMGGADTEVDDTTKNIIIECANFDMYSIRKTSMEHGLFTDAVTRFNKGQSPLQTDNVLEEAVATTQYVSGASVASEVFDIKQGLPDLPKVEVDAEFINKRLGLDLSAEEMAQWLRNVEFSVEIHDNRLHITAPFWRTDIEIAEDVVEEVGRLIGFDRLPLELPKRAIKPTVRSQMLDFKTSVRNHLSAMGANEALTYSFVHGDLLNTVGQDKQKAFQLSNALSPDLQYYRMSLMPSLLSHVSANIRADYVRTNDDNEFAMFEIGKIHVKGHNDTNEAAVPAEFQRLSFVFAADDKTAQRKYSGAAYYQTQTYLRELMFALNINYRLEVIDHEPNSDESKQMLAPFEISRTAAVTIEGQLAGFIGEYSRSIRKALKLPVYCAGYELDLNLLMQHAKRSQYKPLPRFPKVVQDITLRVPAAAPYRAVLDEVVAGLHEVTGDDMFASLPTQDIYQKPGDEFKHITFRLWVAHHKKTLQAQEVNALLDKVAERTKNNLGAERI